MHSTRHLHLLAAVAVFGAVALGPSEGRADDSLPNCYATMGLCGAECSIPYVPDWGLTEESCTGICSDYGGVHWAYAVGDPVVGDIVCECNWDCPWYAY
jgi:hypothetical protein